MRWRHGLLAMWVCGTLASCAGEDRTKSGAPDEGMTGPADAGGGEPDGGEPPDAAGEDQGGAVDSGGGGGGDDGGGGGPAGPWPITELVLYGSAEGIGDELVDASPDDGQNIWAASQHALYVLRPGQTRFERYTVADGLHIVPFMEPEGRPSASVITALAGGHAGEVFVGYYGYESTDPFNDTPQQKELGNADRVVLGPGRQIAITRYLFPCDYGAGGGCWENRSARRMLYAHDGAAAGHLFIGFNHGVSHVFDGRIGDHVHPEIFYQPGNIMKLGEYLGLAVLPSGDLWVAGRHGVGLQPFDPEPHFKWVDRRFTYAFTTDTPDHELDVPIGYREDNSGAAVTPDGVLWLARMRGGLASWDPRTVALSTIRKWPQAPSDLMDVQADPTGRLWLVTSDGRLWRFDPATGALGQFSGVSGVRRIYADTRVVPYAVYAATLSGLAVIRGR